MEINRVEEQTALWQAAQLESKKAAAEAQQQAAKVQGKPPAGEGGQNADKVASQPPQVDVSALTETETSDSDAAYQAIVAKVNSGQELTGAELSTLRSKNAALYAQAMQAQTARIQLRQQMEADPAKASQAAKQAVSALARDEDSDKTLEESAVVRQALDTEYRRFAARYDQVALSGQLFK